MQDNSPFINNKLSHTIVTLYVITLITLAIVTMFALKQNWDVRLETRKNILTETAKIGNIVLEDALIIANNRLLNVRQSIETSFVNGTLTSDEIHQIVNESAIEFKNYNENHELGLIFYIDPSGMGYSDTGAYPSDSINFSDRYYYKDLKDNSYKSNTVGPIVKSGLAGQWMFHMSVPLKNSKGKFSGVIVQQISPSIIANNLAKVIDRNNFDKMDIFYPGSPLLFSYPEVNHYQKYGYLNASINTSTESPTIQKIKNTEDELAIHSESKLLKITSFATFPISLIKQEFFRGNVYTFVYAVLSALFVTSLFFYLYRLSKQLNIAQNSSMHDSMTSLHNRRALDDQLPILLRESMRSQTPLSLLFIDIDYFSIFNAKYGHKTGDEALKLVADSLASICQRPLDFICRWGGEEFVALLPNTDGSAASKIAQDMLEAVRQIRIKGTNHKALMLTVSIGCITHTVTTESLEDDLVGAADEAMLQAKNLGRNKSVVSYLSTPYRDNKIKKAI